MAHIEGIKSQLAAIANDSTLMDMIIEFERTLDNSGLFAYKNWLAGELVDGPHLEKYWFVCTFMYPYSMMPDPMGGMRLQKYGCKVVYKEDILEVPIKITNNSSYSNPYSKSAKLKKHKVWLIEITMPRQFIDERLDDINSSGNSIDVDTDDISSAYDADLEEVFDPATGEADSAEDFGGDEDFGDDETEGEEF